MEATTTVKWHGAEVLGRAQSGARKGALDHAMQVQKVAQELVPVEFHTLQGDVVTEPLRDGRIGARVAFGGGPAAAYAAVQHEDTSLNHPKGGQAKYLEQPAKEMVGEQEATIGAAIADALKG